MTMGGAMYTMDKFWNGAGLKPQLLFDPYVCPISSSPRKNLAADFPSVWLPQEMIIGSLEDWEDNTCFFFFFLVLQGPSKGDCTSLSRGTDLDLEMRKVLAGFSTSCLNLF